MAEGYLFLISGVFIFACPLVMLVLFSRIAGSRKDVEATRSRRLKIFMLPIVALLAFAPIEVKTQRYEASHQGPNSGGAVIRIDLLLFLPAVAVTMLSWPLLLLRRFNAETDNPDHAIKGIIYTASEMEEFNKRGSASGIVFTEPEVEKFKDRDRR